MCAKVFIDLLISPLANTDRAVYIVPCTVLSSQDMTINKEDIFILLPSRQKGR